MTKFIRLTECKGNILIINIARIEHVTKGGSDTYIKLFSNTDNYYFVKETVEEIWEALNG